MAPRGDLLQSILAAAQHHRIAQVQECGDQFPHRPPARHSVLVERDQTGGERRLQRRQGEQLLADLLGTVAAFGGDHDPQPVAAVGQIRHVGHTGHLARLDQSPDPFLHGVTRDTGRQLGDDDVLPVDRHRATHGERTAAGGHVLPQPGRADHGGAAAPVGAGNEFHQPVVGHVRGLQQRPAGSHDLARIVCRYLGGPPFGDADRAVAEQNRPSRRQHRGFGPFTVEGLHHRHCVIVEFGGQRRTGCRQPHLGVAVSGGDVALDAGEGTLSVNDFHALELGGHQRRCPVHRRAAVWVQVAGDG